MQLAYSTECRSEKARAQFLTVVDTSGVSVAVSGVQDGALAQLDGLLHGHVIPPVAA